MNEQVRAESSSPTCWHCGQPAQGHFCAACEKIQPLAATLDYFSFLSLPRQLNIDNAQLENRFYELSRKFHPDFYFNASEAERQYSMDRSSMLNDAYRTLRDPIKRAGYLLNLEDINTADRKGKTPPDLLAEVFELNEEMEELRAAKKANKKEEIAQLKQQLLAMEKMLKERDDSLRRKLSAAFDKFDALGPDAPERRQVLSEINDQLAHLSYISNLIDSIEEEI